jgi:hypothetical protein
VAIGLAALFIAPAHAMDPVLDAFGEPVGTVSEPSVAEKVEREQALSFYKSLQLDDDVVVTGFVASRKPHSADSLEPSVLDHNAADYRTYLGVRYKHDLGDVLQLSGHTFYGAGTYDGDHSYVDPTDGALPDEVRSSGDPIGEWVGADWKVSSRLSSRHVVQTGIEYRQELGMQLFGQDALFGKSSIVDGENLRRRLGVVTTSQLAVTDSVSLNTGLRYGGNYEMSHDSIDPRVEVLYRPMSNATVKALFNQVDNAPVSLDRAYPAVSVAEDSNRIRNYELAYEQSVTERNRVRLAAYRYNVEGALAGAPADAVATGLDSTAHVDASGFEVGMERRQPGGTRASVSYAWQQTTDSVLSAVQGATGRHLTKLSVGVPLLSRKLSTAFELQYHDLVGPMLQEERRDFVIGNVTLANGELLRNTDLSFGVHNVFDVRDDQSGPQLIPFLPADGRSLRLDLKRKF